MTLDYAHPETLVSTQWLAEHLDEPNLCMIEMDLDSQAYDREHIPGSIFWSAYALLLDNLQINFSLKAMEKLLADSGITKDTTVIAVHNGFIATSGFIFWLFKVLGHQNVKILNGGRPKWQKEGFPVTRERTIVSSSHYRISAIDNSLRVTSPEVKKFLARQVCILLDARTTAEYQGAIFLQQPPQANERAGHIPGAVHLYYELAHNEDGTFKSAEELHKIYTDLNIPSDKLIIPYCAVGARSGHTWFILKYLLGYPQVKNYDGSWNEWSRLPDASIELSLAE